MVLVALGLLAIVMLGMVGLTLVWMGGRGTDWGAFYAAGMIVRTGDAANLYDSALQAATQAQLFGPSDQENAFPLPAFFAFAIAPLTALPFSASYAVWFALNVAIVAGLAMAASRYLAPMPSYARRVYIAAAVLSTPVAAAVAQGQLDLLVLASMLTSWWLLSRGHRVAAGLVLAIALVKPHFVLAPLLLLALNREWRTLAAFVAVASVLLLFPVMLTSPELLLDQARLVGSYPGSADEHSVNARSMANLRGTVTSLYASASPLLWGPPLLAAAAMAMMLAVSRWRRLPAVHPQAWALAFVLPVIYSPHVHFHSLVLVLAAVTLWARSRVDAGQPPQATRVVMCHLVLTMLWLLSASSVGLVSLAVLAAFAVCYAEWPQAPLRLPRRRARSHRTTTQVDAFAAAR
jgi:hypothetical protein